MVLALPLLYGILTLCLNLEAWLPAPPEGVWASAPRSAPLVTATGRAGQGAMAAAPGGARRSSLRNAGTVSNSDTKNVNVGAAHVHWAANLESTDVPDDVGLPGEVGFQCDVGAPSERCSC